MSALAGAAPALLMVLLLTLGIAARTEPLGGLFAEDPAAALMERARSLRREMRGLPGEELPEARAAVIAAYREVYLAHPRSGAIAGEAAFRAGELLRTAGANREARQEFQRVQSLAAADSLGARAGLELAHLDRREARFRDALAAYAAVAASPSATPAQRDEALLWAGRMHAQRGHGAEARGVWTRVADTAEDPLDRVRAFDHLAQQLVASGDLEGAAGMLARARLKLAGIALEATERGARVASALERMRALELLKQEVARRREGVRVSR